MHRGSGIRNKCRSLGAQPRRQLCRLAAGYPPDIVTRKPDGTFVDSLWLHYWAQFWEVTACQWQKRFDPTYNTYVSGLGNYV